MSKKDPYIYESSETLINIFNIRDAKILNKLENDIIPGRILSIKRVGFQIHSVFDIKSKGIVSSLGTARIKSK